MHPSDMAARLMREMDEVEAYWEACQARRSERPHPEDDHEMGVIYAVLLMDIAAGVDRLSKSWMYDRWDAEATVESVL